MDQVSKNRAQYRAEMDVFMGGKVAEELIYGTDAVSSGAASVSQQSRTSNRRD